MSEAAERWATVKRICNEVAETAENERAALLDALTKDQPELREDVGSLLDACREAEAALPVPDARTFQGWFAGEGATDRHLGPYRIVREIASGGMGVVYEAEQDEPKRRVALKVLRAGLDSEEARSRFQREARILGNLQDAGIAALYGVGTHEAASGERVPYLVMELVRGGRPITAYADAHHLDLKRRLQLFLDAAAAVAAGHRRGIIHRDLKPDNVLVDDAGHVKVVDFGIARITAADLAPSAVTATGLLMGTFGYIAPEQLDGRASADDVRMDVYALGALLYLLLTGHTPLDLGNLDVLAAVRATLEQPVTPPTRYVPDMPRDLALVVTKALAKEPDARYASVDALAEDVEHFLANEPIRARPPSVSYQMRLFARRHRVGVAAAMVVALALGAATWFSLRAAHREAEQARRAVASEKRATGLLVGSQDLVRSLFTDLYDDLEKVPGTLPARLALVRRLETGMQSVQLHGADDPRVLRLAGLVHMHVGLLNFRTGGDHLGRPEAALAAFAQARRAFELVLEQVDGDPEASLIDRMHLAETLGYTADVDFFLGRTTEARDAALDVVDRLAALHREAPGETSIRDVLAGQRTRLASMQRGLEQIQPAIETLEDALADLPALEDIAPEDTVTLGTRGYAHAVLGEILRDEGKLDEGRVQLQAALEAFEKLVQGHPEDPSAGSRLGRAHGELGVLAFRANDLATAEAHLAKALELGRAQAARDAEDRQAQQSLQIDLARMATLREAQDRLPDAIDFQTEAVGIIRALADEAPDAFVAQLELRIALNHLGGQLTRGERVAEAVPVFEEAHALAQRLVEAHPDDARARLSWAEALDALGIARWSSAVALPPEEKRAPIETARELFVESLAVHQALADDGLLPATHREILDLLPRKIDVCDQNLATITELGH